MADHAHSDHPAVQAQLDRLAALSPGRDVLGLERICELCDRLGNPQDALPPVFHVAGTNGKGSTCAFLRAIGEAAGQRVHVYTSPHLVHFHERVRLAGALVSDAELTAALEEAEAANAGEPITVFEITTAAAFLLFSRVPADLLVLEVGLGGRLDATNVVDRPVATAIASVSMDHMDFLGDTLGVIAEEKAGIIKPGVPCATSVRPSRLRWRLRKRARPRLRRPRQPSRPRQKPGQAHSPQLAPRHSPCPPWCASTIRRCAAWSTTSSPAPSRSSVWKTGSRRVRACRLACVWSDRMARS